MMAFLNRWLRALCRVLRRKPENNEVKGCIYPDPHDA